VPSINGILFDLDGTLADTAQDLANALNHVLIKNNQQPLSFETIRPVVSHGGIALIRLGFNLEPEHPDFEPLRQCLLDYYKQNICTDTKLFPGLEKLLSQLEQQNILWGIVTNKPDWLTLPLVDELKLTQRAASIVSGNTLKESKPHPAPLLHACKEMNLEPKQCIYIGDAARDIEAGKRAGMRTIAAAYGYVEAHDPAERWDADFIVYEPHELIKILNLD